MKKLFFILIFISGVLFSCSNDDSNELNEEVTSEGKGEYAKYDNYEDSPIYKKIIAKKVEYPEGRSWTNVNKASFGASNENIVGYACAGFAFILSDAAFDELPTREHKDVNKIRIGDIIRVKNSTGGHSLVTLYVEDNIVTVVEGNYGGKIKWGRKIPLKNLKSKLDYIKTRYPK